MRDLFVADLPTVVQATGMDNEAAINPPSTLQQALHSGRDRVRSSAQQDDLGAGLATEKKSPKPLQLADLGDDVRCDTRQNKSAPSRTRTLNLLIKSQLLCQLS